MPTVGEVEAADECGSHRSGFFAILAVLGGAPIAINCGAYPRQLITASCFAAAFITYSTSRSSPAAQRCWPDCAYPRPCAGIL
jgi:hypothetical protein